MKEGEQPNKEEAPVRVYRFILRLYPRPFRERFSDVMLQHFRDQWRETHRGPDRYARVRFWRNLTIDAAATLSREHARHLRKQGTQLAHFRIYPSIHAPMKTKLTRILTVGGILVPTLLATILALQLKSLEKRFDEFRAQSDRAVQLPAKIEIARTGARPADGSGGYTIRGRIKYVSYVHRRISERMLENVGPPRPPLPSYTEEQRFSATFSNRIWAIELRPTPGSSHASDLIAVKQLFDGENVTTMTYWKFPASATDHGHVRVEHTDLPSTRGVFGHMFQNLWLAYGSAQYFNTVTNTVPLLFSADRPKDGTCPAVWERYSDGNGLPRWIKFFPTIHSDRKYSTQFLRGPDGSWTPAGNFR